MGGSKLAHASRSAAVCWYSILREFAFRLISVVISLTRAKIEVILLICSEDIRDALLLDEYLSKTESDFSTRLRDWHSIIWVISWFIFPFPPCLVARSLLLD